MQQLLNSKRHIAQKRIALLIKTVQIDILSVKRALDHKFKIPERFLKHYDSSCSHHCKKAFNMNNNLRKLTFICFNANAFQDFEAFWNKTFHIGITYLYIQCHPFLEHRAIMTDHYQKMMLHNATLSAELAVPTLSGWCMFCMVSSVSFPSYQFLTTNTLRNLIIKII